VTVTPAGLGIASGAVYSPESLTVPEIAFPFVTPFTCDSTAEFTELVTKAWNCCVCPSPTNALPGSSNTVTLGNGGLPAYPQPPSAIAINTKTAKACSNLSNASENCEAPTFLRGVTQHGPLVPKIFILAQHNRTRCAKATHTHQSPNHHIKAIAAVPKHRQTPQSEMVNGNAKLASPDPTPLNTETAKRIEKSANPAMAQNPTDPFRFGIARAVKIARASLCKRRRCLTQHNG